MKTSESADGQGRSSLIAEPIKTANDFVHRLTARLRPAFNRLRAFGTSTPTHRQEEMLRFCQSSSPKKTETMTPVFGKSHHGIFLGTALATVILLFDVPSALFHLFLC